MHGLHDHYSSYNTNIIWITLFKRGKFCVQDDEKSWRFILVSTPENIDAVPEDFVQILQLYRFC